MDLGAVCHVSRFLCQLSPGFKLILGVFKTWLYLQQVDEAPEATQPPAEDTPTEEPAVAEAAEVGPTCTRGTRGSHYKCRSINSK